MGFTVVDTKYVNGDDPKFNKRREPGAKFLEHETVTKQGQKLITGVEVEGDGIIKATPKTIEAQNAKDAAIKRLGKSKYNARQAIDENKQIKALTSDKLKYGNDYGNYQLKNDTDADLKKLSDIEKVKEERRKQSGYSKQNTDSIMPSPLKGNADQIELNKKWNQSAEQDAKDAAIKKMPTDRARHLKDAQEAAAKAKELVKEKIASQVKDADYLKIKNKK